MFVVKVKKLNQIKVNPGRHWIPAFAGTTILSEDLHALSEYHLYD